MSFRKSSLRPQRSRRLAPVAARVWQHRMLSQSVESLEERQMLSAVLPGLDDHGVTIRNAQATGLASINITSMQNSRLSNNADGSGLFIELSNVGGALNSLKTISVTGVTIANNGNAGAQIRLTNMSLDNLIIDRAVVTGNGGAGLVLDLTNTSIKNLTIWDSTNDFSPTAIRNPNSGASRYVGNMFDGIHLLGANLAIDSLRIAGNVVASNAGTGIFINTNVANIGTLSLQDNEVRNNTSNATTPVSFASGSGVRFQTNRTNLGFVGSSITFNTITGNAQHGLSFLEQSLLPGNIPTNAPSNFDVGLITDNAFNNNGGSGLSVDLRQSTTWDATVMRNTFVTNGLRGFDLQGSDTVGAFDVQIGGLATNPTGVLVNGNTFTNNLGSAIAIELNDLSGDLGNSTGKFLIFGNVMTGQRRQNNVYAGEGIRVRLRGDVTRQNGAARIFDSIIDRNTINSNAGDGIKIDVAEDSELLNLLIGNATGVNQTFDVNGALAGGGNVPTQLGDGNIIRNNGGNGISVIRLSSSIVDEIRILDNQITGNAEGLYLQASNTYQTIPNAARPNLKVVSGFTVNTNDLSNNRLNGVHLRTEFDAVLLADMRYNRIDGNAWNGVRVTGLENAGNDFENVGGRWIKNAVTNNGIGLAANLIALGHGNGIRIETVVGSVNPLIIGQDGFDLLDRQSLGNYIALNGEDGIEIGARAGGTTGGTTVVPVDIRDGLEIVNNQIVSNGQNDFNLPVPDPYTAGKGIDIEVLQFQPREFRIDRNTIQGNAGDGIELNNHGGMLRITGVGNFIDINGGRGIDLLNQAGEIDIPAEAFVRFGDKATTTVPGLVGGVFQQIAVSNRNVITRNGLEGFYVVNTSVPAQRQDVNAEAVLATWTVTGRAVQPDVTVNLVLDLENNEIRDNGLGVADTGSPPSTLSGTGLVLRVGSQYSAGDWGTIADLTGLADVFSNEAAAGVGTNGFQGPGSVIGGFGTSANGRVNARIVENEFSGNGGDDVLIESFVSLLPRSTSGEWNEMFFRNVNVYDRDPLSRLNLEFVGNTGDSIDVVRGTGANDEQTYSYTNGEGDFKSRTVRQGPNPSGPFASNQAGRDRLATRVADRPLSIGPDGALVSAFPDSYSGLTGFGQPFGGPNTPQLGFGTTATGSLGLVDGTNTAGPVVVNVSSRTGVIEDATNVNNVAEIVSPAHGLNTGDRIFIEGTTGGFTEINNGPNFRGRPAYWTVEVVNGSTFRIRNPITGQLVAGTGNFGGTPVWTLVRGGGVFDASNTDPSLLTIFNHGLNDGDNITIDGARGNTAINNGIVPMVTITGATNANPSVITSAGHGLTSGEQITITGAVGNTAINGTWLVDVIDADTFRILDPGTMTAVAGNGNYVPGTGMWRRAVTIQGASNANPSIIASANHGLVTGEWINIVGAAGNTNINGTWVVERIDNDLFVLRNPDTNALVAGNGAYTANSARWSRATPQQWEVQVVDVDTIQLVHPGTGMVVAGNGPYVLGTATWGGGILGRHNLTDGDIISVTGSGVSTANGVAVVRVLNSSSFELYVPNDSFQFLVPVLGDGSVSTGGSYYVHNPSKFQYDGLGPSTFRVESNWDVSGFDRGDGFNVSTSVGNSPTLFAYDEVATGTFSFMTAWINDVAVNEGNTATLTVTLSEDAPVGGVRIFYNLSDGTALADPNNDGNPVEGDYDPATIGFIDIIEGQRTGTITVQVKTDGVFDPSEQFYVDLFQISTGDFVDSRGVVSVRQAPQITVDSPEVTEGDNGTKILTYTVSLATDDPSQTISVDYATSNGTATAGTDYVAKSGTITFGPGETTKTISIVVNGDLNVEGNETVLLTLSNPTNGATLPAPVSTGTILNDDTPSITISDVEVTEGSGNAVFTVTLSKAVNSTVTVSFATANGNALANQDYTPRSGMLTFLAGETSKQFTVAILDDNVTEAVETFTVNLSNETNSTIGKAAGTATILDDDTPSVTIGTPVVETEGDGTTNMVFTVTLSKAFTSPVTVSYATSDGTATAGTDYVARTGTVTFAAGETTATFVVQLIGDRVIEQTERFNVTLTNAVNGNVTQGTSTGVILDDDTPSITIDDVGVLESDGFAFFTVSLSKAVSSAVSVDYRTVSGTATSGVDFEATAGTLLFQPGQTTQTIFVQIAQDSQGESIETFFIDLSMPVDGTIGDSRGVGRIIDAAFATTLVVAPNTGSDPVVKVYGSNPNVQRFPAFYAYDPSFRGGVRVALGDVNGDGVSDIVTSPASGVAPVRVFDGRSGALVSSFFPYSPNFTGGLSIAADDLNGDGRAEIVVGLASNGSAIRVFNGANGAIIAAYYAFSPAFLGGVNVAVGDVTGDGRSELIVGLASQGSAIRVLQPITGSVLSAFYPFNPSFSGGINVAVGDVNGDGRGEVIAGLASLGSAVRVFDTANLIAPSIVSLWQAFPGFSGGVSVGTTDLDFDGRAEVIVAPVAHSTPGTRFFNGLTGQSVASTKPFTEYNTGGWVAGETLDLVGSPLRLDGAVLARSNAAAVTQAQIAELTEAAIAKFAAAGASADALAKLANVRFEVGRLPGTYLGLSGAGLVVIDVNAGGRGWFVDSTPNLDEEFARDANGTLRAVSAQAVGKVDLLSVIVHELAHQLGFDDLNPAIAPNSVLAESLAVSVRRASKENVDDLFADGDLLSELLLA